MKEHTRLIKTFGMLLIAVLLFAALPVGEAMAQDPITVCASVCDYTTIQDAIDAANAGDTINVYPGTYDETASGRTLFNGNGPYQFGLFFEDGKDGITLQGVDAAGVPITACDDVEASITTNATNSFGHSGVFVEADDIIITGLEFLENVPGDNKTFEVIGDNITFRDNVFGLTYGGSFYINDWRYDDVTPASHVETYTITENCFMYGGSIDISSGVGVTGDSANRIIQDNVFTGDGNDVFWANISFNGTVPDVGWFVYPVGGATISGNSFEGITIPIRSRGTVEEDDFHWLSYWNDNIFEKAVVAWDTAVGMPRSYDYTSDSKLMNNTRRIGTVIKEEVNNAADDDEVWVADGTYIEEVLIAKPVHVIGQGTGTIVQSPHTIVQTLTPGGSSHPIVLVADTDRVIIENLVVDGAGKGNSNHKFVGMGFYNASGTVQNIVIENIEHTPFNGAQGGVAFYGYFDDGERHLLSVLDSTFEDFQKNGPTFYSDSTPVILDVIGNTITGKGATDVTAQNGIQVQGPAINATIKDNLITGIGYDNTDADTKWAATSILNYYAFATIENNTVTGGHLGVYNIDAPAQILDNFFSIEKIGVYAYGIIATDPPEAVPSGLDIVDRAELGMDGTRTAALDVEIRGNEVNFLGDDNSSTYGIEADAGYGPENLSILIEENIIHSFDYGIVIYQADYYPGVFTNVDAYQNCIYNSASFGLWANEEAMTVDAINNFWGDPSGPAHSTNPDGLGDEVSDGVLFEPWLSRCPLVAKTSPVAVDDAYETDMNMTLDVDAPGVLENDSGEDDTKLVANLVTDIPGGEGSFTLSQDGGFTYVPPADWLGATSFTYMACYKDQPGNCSDPATVNIIVDEKKGTDYYFPIFFN